MRHVTTIRLDRKISEGSGMILWDNMIFTHNDSGNPSLFAIDTATGAIAGKYDFPKFKNRDWEDMDQDSRNIYIGNFGNNSQKIDTLQIYIIKKSSFLQGKPVMDSLRFVWPKDVAAKKRNRNKDCEAMAIIGDSIYLFTKEWKKKRVTRIFSLPAKPGIYVAKYRSTLPTNILVTGASYHAPTKKLVLCGYTLLLKPALLVFTDITQETISNGEVLYKTRLPLSFRQVEGIATDDGIHYYLISENFRFLFLRHRQALHKLTLKD